MQNKEPFSYSGAIFTLLLSTETSLMARAVTVSIPEHEPWGPVQREDQYSVKTSTAWRPVQNAYVDVFTLASNRQMDNSTDKSWQAEENNISLKLSNWIWELQPHSSAAGWCYWNAFCLLATAWAWVTNAESGRIKQHWEQKERLLLEFPVGVTHTS